MNSQEVIVLARYVRALCPQQRFDEYTPDAWTDVLTPYPLEDARQAAARIARRQPFIAPAEIITEIRAIRAERLEGFQYEPTPDETPREYLTRLRAQRAAVASGHRPPAVDRPALPGPTVPEVLARLGTVGQEIPADDKPTPGLGVLAIRCPKCGALPGRHCTWAGGMRRPAHEARKRVAAGGHVYDPAAARAEEERRAASAAWLASHGGDGQEADR